jgi:hypothetical protein
LPAPADSDFSDEEPVTLERKSPVAVLLAGVGLMVVVALAAWSTVRDPDVSTDVSTEVRAAPAAPTPATTPDQPIIAPPREAEAGPVPIQAASLVEPEEVDVDSTKEPQGEAASDDEAPVALEATPADPTDPPPKPETVAVESIAATPEPTIDEKTAPPRKRPEATRPSPRRKPKNESTASPPDLVTEW